MAFLQKRFLYQTKLKPSLLGYNKLFRRLRHFFFKPLESFLQKPCSSNKNKLKNQKGSISLLLLPLISLMMTGIIGLVSLSVGIKNITQAQSTCINRNLKGQKELGVLLEKILKLNEKVLQLHKTRQALQASLAGAIASGQLQLIASLKKTLSLVKKAQDLLRLKQKHILAQSQFVKAENFKELKKDFKDLPVSQLKEKVFYKPALALETRKEGDKTYTYKPVPNFTEQQKRQFSWKMNPFYPLDTSWLNFKRKKLFQYQCTASLTKKGEIWISHLYH